MGDSQRLDFMFRSFVTLNMEQTERSETSAHKIQTPENHKRKNTTRVSNLSGTCSNFVLAATLFLGEPRHHSRMFSDGLHL